MKKSKWYSAVLVLAVLSLILTACAPKVAPTATTLPPVTLNIMDNWGDEVNAKGPPLKAAFAGFMAANPNITIKEEVFADKDIPTKVVTMFTSGDEPDLVFQNLQMAALDWLDDGVTVDMTPLAKQWGIYDTLKPEAVAEWTDAKGRLRGIPLEGYNWPLWFNTDILKKAGVEIPKTTDELIAAAAKIRAAGYQPFTTGGSEWTGQFVFFGFLTTMLTDAEIRELYSKGGFASNAHAVAAVETFVKMRDAGVFSNGAEGLTVAASNEEFYSGKAAIQHGGQWFFAECPEAIRANVVLGGFPLPPGSPRSKPVVYKSFEGKAVWITRNGAKKLDAVEKFMKFFFTPKVMAMFVEQAAMGSPLKDTPVDSSKLNPLFLQANSSAYQSATEVALIHKVYVPTTVDANLRRVANEAWVPGTSAATILANMDASYK